MEHELSSEDALRLNVLMTANPVQAVRIDTNSMTLHALTEAGEARIPLHPNCRAEQYLQRVKEFLGGHALGSPGGYPVYLQRWTRMGQTSDKNLAALLLLGEPEAVVAVAHAPGLTDELARRAWWCQPTMEMARWMLEKEAVIQGGMGRVLADFLIEHLAFEENPDNRMHTIRLVLYGRLADAVLLQKLWRMARQVPYYYIGFLEFMGDELPPDAPARPLPDALAALAAAGNPYARLYADTLSAHGQTYLMAASEVLQKPSTHLVVYALLDAFKRRYLSLDAPLEADRLEDLQGQVQALCADGAQRPATLSEVLDALPAERRGIQAMLTLSGLSGKVADPYLLRTTAVGALMRRKIEPLVKPIQGEIRILQGAAG